MYLETAKTLRHPLNGNTMKMLKVMAWYCMAVLIPLLYGCGEDGELPSPDETRPSVGAIRWDGWVGDLNKAGLEVEYTMGPPKYHYRAPFYSKKIAGDSIQCRATSQEIIDREIAYAKQAGLDYWAFCWYPPHTGLDTARQLYLASRHKNDINWCVILGTNPFDYAVDGKWLTERFREQNYQKVQGGRPLVYVFPSGTTGQDIEKLTALATGASLPAPYVVAMAFDGNSADSIAKTIGADAISCYASTYNYATGEQYDGEPYYPNVEKSDEAGWTKYQATGNKIVPWVTAGWSPRPRIERSVSWGAFYKENGWAADGSPEEVARNLENAINWSKSHPDVTEANTILIYAWNEFDEGGWLCPTEGDGTKRVDALKNILKN